MNVNGLELKIISDFALLPTGGVTLPPALQGQRVEAATLLNPPLGTYGFQTSLIHPGFLAGLRHPWHFDWQLYEASDGDRRFSSTKRGGAFRRPCLKWRGGLFGSKRVKKVLGCLSVSKWRRDSEQV